MIQVAKLVVDEEAFHFFARCSPAERRRLMQLLEALRLNPDMEEGLPAKDPTGRPLRIKAARPFMVTWWLDPWVREVRVVRIERAG